MRQNSTLQLQYLKTEIRDRVLWVWLNRPERRNAFNPHMINELRATFVGAPSKGVRALVLAGEGPSFSAGGDLEWMKSMASYTYEQNLEDSDQLFAMYEAARRCEIPLIGRAHGHAFGGGLGLLTVCDVVAADSATQFCFSEVKLGLIPAVISSFVLEKMAPHKVRQWSLTAAVFTAAEAMQAGLVHFVGSSTELDQFIDRHLGLIKKAGPEAVAATKRMFNYLADNPASQYRAYCTKLIAEARAGAEGQAGLRSFFEKTSVPWA